MPPKKNKNVVQFEPPFMFPTHREIEENLQRRLRFWENPERKGDYPLPVLDFLINAIGYELEIGEDEEEFGKDAAFYNSSWYVKGITNGEFFYSLYKTILRMAEDENLDFSQLPMCDQQVFASMLGLATDLFRDRRKEPGFGNDAIDLWVLYAWTRKMRNYAIWTAESGEPSDAPSLQELTDDDWDIIIEDVKEHFLEEGEDEYIEMALLDQQPHWPTVQEFRSAKAHLLNWYCRTRENAGQKGA